MFSLSVKQGAAGLAVNIREDKQFLYQSCLDAIDRQTPQSALITLTPWRSIIGYCFCCLQYLKPLVLKFMEGGLKSMPVLRRRLKLGHRNNTTKYGFMKRYTFRIQLHYKIGFCNDDNNLKF